MKKPFGSFRTKLICENSGNTDSLGIEQNSQGDSRQNAE